MDGIFYETRPSFDRVIVGGICARGNSWDERGLTKKIRIQFFLVHTWSLPCLHKIYGSRQGSNIRSQKEGPKFVGSVYCTNDGCDAIDNNTNIFLSSKI